MLQYQIEAIETFLAMIPCTPGTILEIGSDIKGDVATAIADRTGSIVVGLNPSPEFPDIEKSARGRDNPVFIRGDGRSLPFDNDQFDAVLSLATMEHVNGIEAFLSETLRVLKPEGLFYTNFGPIWSSASEHHVYAKSGTKEARFWKPGKNPIPDYAHLLMTPDEIREYLNSGPCSDELIQPILHWIYYGDDINRCHFEEYLYEFKKLSDPIQCLRFENSSGPGPETNGLLRAKYGQDCNFECSTIIAIIRKLPKGGTLNTVMFRFRISLKKKCSDMRFWIYDQFSRTLPKLIIWLIGLLRGTRGRNSRY